MDGSGTVELTANRNGEPDLTFQLPMPVNTEPFIQIDPLFPTTGVDELVNTQLALVPTEPAEDEFFITTQ